MVSGIGHNKKELVNINPYIYVCMGVSGLRETVGFVIAGGECEASRFRFEGTSFCWRRTLRLK